jgi:hypothetical protein
MHSFFPTFKVEWLFAFEIQCNAFVPVFFLLYVVQFLLLPLLLQAIVPSSNPSTTTTVDGLYSPSPSKPSTRAAITSQTSTALIVTVL